MGTLEGRVALVTGASRGIGRAIAVGLAGEGAKVAVNFQSDSSGAGETAALVAEAGSRALMVQADLRDPEAVSALFAETEKVLGPVDILIANAGITRDGLALRMSPEQWDDVIATDLTAPFLCTKAALRHMMKARWGRVVFISSVAGLKGNAGQANYSAAKAGLLGLAKSLAREVGSRGITVNVVAPGFIETDMTSGLDEKVRDAALEQIPSESFGQPEDVAAAVVFLSGPDAGYINGAVLPVDGGMSM
ncbi:MAG: 3-oxoacyl-[acyl-carrier-protein] reductase [Acidobacteria bacterium]|nr:MAG: 3-oxoacyl-[acyl-carrier-protein] reductase [Acidobacteriota bacterium]